MTIEAIMEKWSLGRREATIVQCAYADELPSPIGTNPSRLEKLRLYYPAEAGSLVTVLSEYIENDD